MLLDTGNPGTSLEIIPASHSNIARFLNSANLDRDCKNKSFKNNVSLFRTSYEGKVTAIMYTNRRIDQGEEL